VLRGGLRHHRPLRWPGGAAEASRPGRYQDRRTGVPHRLVPATASRCRPHPPRAPGLRGRARPLAVWL